MSVIKRLANLVLQCTPNERVLRSKLVEALQTLMGVIPVDGVKKRFFTADEESEMVRIPYRCTLY